MASSRHLINHPLFGSGTVSPLDWRSELDSGANEWPADSSPGFSHWEAAVLGATFEYPSFTNIDGTVVLVGGSASQAKRPVYEYTLDAYPYDYCGLSTIDYYTASFTRPAMSDFVVDSNNDGTFSLLDGGRVDTEHASAFQEPTVDAAVANTEPNGYLVAGGRGHANPQGRKEIWLFGETGSVEVGLMRNQRYGADVVFDPVSLRSFVFGGTDDPNAMDLAVVYSLLSVDGMTDVWADGVVNDPARPASLEWAYVEPVDGGDIEGGRYRVTLETYLEFTCANSSAWRVDWLTDDSCFIGSLHLNVPDAVSVDWGNVSVTLIDGTTEYDLKPYEVSPVGVPQFSDYERHSFTLPRTYFPGDTAKVRVTGSVALEQRTSGGPGSELLGNATMEPVADYFSRGQPPCEPSAALALSGVPAWPVANTTYPYDPSVHGSGWAHWDLRVTTPAGLRGQGMSAFASGPRAECGPIWDQDWAAPIVAGGSEACFASGWPMEVRWGWVFVTEGLVDLGDHDTSHNFWVESCAQAPSLAVIENVVTLLPYKMEQVVQSFGPEPSHGDDVLFLMEFAGDNASGRTFPGFHHVYSLTEFGDIRLDLDEPEELGGLVIHEYAHDWLGIKTRSLEKEADWIVESLPELATVLAFPRTRDNIHTGLDAIMAHSMSPEEVALERVDGTSPSVVAKYDVGPYTIAQYRAMWLNPAVGGYTQLDEAVAAIDSVLIDPFIDDAPFQGPQAVLRTDVEGFFGQPFYDEWIAAGRVGTPLLGISGVTLDPASGTMEVRVVQTQVSAMAWPVFSNVPYVLACDDPSNYVVAAGCGAGEWDVYGVTQLHGSRASGAYDETLVLPIVPVIPAPPGGPGSQSLNVALITADLIRPGWPSTTPDAWPVRHPDDSNSSEVVVAQWIYMWLLKCSDSGAPGCDPAIHGDLDADDWVNAADCRPDEPPPGAMNPGVPDLAWSVGDLDLNCDRWPREGW